MQKNKKITKNNREPFQKNPMEESDTLGDDDSYAGLDILQQVQHAVKSLDGRNCRSKRFAAVQRLRALSIAGML